MKKEYINLKDNIIDFIKKVVELNEDYVINWDIIHRFNKKYKLENYIEMVLENFPDWLHYSEINNKIKEKYKIEEDDIKIHRTLTHWVWTFINIWLWIYTLKSNESFSWENVPDLIYLFLKEQKQPKTLSEITNYVLSRKKIWEKTVLAALNYKNENRFVFYNNKTIWLKEWNLWNIRKKREVPRYEISLSKAYEELLNKKLIPNTFYVDDIKKLLDNNFWNKVSKNAWAISLLLTKQVEKWNLMLKKTNFRYIYSLIK